MYDPERPCVCPLNMPGIDDYLKTTKTPAAPTEVNEAGASEETQT